MLIGSGATAGGGSTGPRPKIATTERREGVPVATGRPAFRSRGRRASHARHKREECACRRSATPSLGGWMRRKGDEPRRTNAARERRNVRLRTNKTALCDVARWTAPPHPEEARRALSKHGRPRIDLRALMVRDAPCGAPHHEAREFAWLFDIVRRDCGQWFASRAARPCPGRAQRDTDLEFTRDRHS